MKIGEARATYSAQIKAYQSQKLTLAKQKQELEDKMKAAPDGATVYAGEAATLELTYNAVAAKQDEYQDYMSQLMEQWSGVMNMEAAKQQGEAMEEYSEDVGKIMEVARRIMKGGEVPSGDEKRLMEYSRELYQAAKNIGAMVKEREREKYKSLWEDEEEPTDSPSAMEVADNTEAFADGPEIVSVSDTMAAAAGESFEATV